LNPTLTTTALLDGLHDHQNTRLWSDFCNRYQPAVVRFARRLGLNEEDARDAAQDALLAFVEAYRAGQYDRRKGRLRTWLYGIAANKIRDSQRRRFRDKALAGPPGKTALIEQLPNDRTMSECWEAEWRQSLVRICIQQVSRQVKPSSMRVFELCILKKRSLEEVADELNMSQEAVLRARSRVLSRMRQVRRMLEPDW
jgi:RNA polymerase sigma factor (sigma-70 family)